MKRPLSDWNKLVMKVFNENKKKPGYSFKKALKDASKLKKNGKATMKKPTKQRRSRKTRYTRKQRA